MDDITYTTAGVGYLLQRNQLIGVDHVPTVWGLGVAIAAEIDQLHQTCSARDEVAILLCGLPCGTSQHATTVWVTDRPGCFAAIYSRLMILGQTVQVGEIVGVCNDPELWAVECPNDIRDLIDR